MKIDTLYFVASHLQFRVKFLLSVVNLETILRKVVVSQ